MSLSASTASEPPSAVAVLRYTDVVLLVVAAPILLLIGVPAVGYGVGAGVWIALRALAVGIERYAASLSDMRRELPLRLGFLIGRLFVLAMTVIFVRKGSGQDAGLTALLVIVFAYTVSLFVSFLDRPKSR